MRIVVCLLAACTAASDSGPIVDAEDSVVEAPADASACGAFEPWDVEDGALETMTLEESG